jgi:hypothetical protein
MSIYVRKSIDVPRRLRLGRNSNNASHANCILLGNGPSLRSHIDFINDCLKTGHAIAFACNTYAMFNIPSIPVPSYYVLGDPLFQSDDYIENLGDIFRSIAYRFPGITFLTSTLIAKHLYSKIAAYSDICCKIVYAPFGPHQVAGKYLFNLEQRIEPYQNILVLMIQYAVFLGFKKINLFGFDLSMSHSYRPKASDYFGDQILTYNWKKKPDEPSALLQKSNSMLVHRQIQVAVESAKALNVEVLWYR